MRSVTSSDPGRNQRKASQTLLAARTVDIPTRYSIETLLGEGAAATTYRAYDHVLDRRVALKVLRRTSRDDDAVSFRFAREARAAASIDHPNVVDVYDFGSHEGSRYLVLQYVPGHNLKELLAESGPLPASEVIRLSRQVLAGLGAIHAAGIVHRDVKPQNVIVGNDGVARVTDFGIALAPTDTRLTTHGTIWGTPAYMAPEQAGGEAVSAQTDLYAVGVMIFEMLTGRLPFTADSPLAVALAQMHNPPPPLREVAPGLDVPPALEAAMLLALAKNPARRFESAAAMSAALDAPMTAGPTSDPTVNLRLNRQEPETVKLAPPVPRPTLARTHPLARIAMVVAAAALLAAVAVRLVLSFGAGAGGGGDRPTATAFRAVLAGGSLSSTPTVTVTAMPSPTPRATIPRIQATIRSVAPVPTSTPALRPQPTTTPPATATLTVRPTETPLPAPAATLLPTDVPAIVVPDEPTSTPTQTPVPVVPDPPTDAPPTWTPAQVVEDSLESASVDPGALPTIAPFGSEPERVDTTRESAVETPSAAAPVSVGFGAFDWQGGYVGDQSWYGRSWVAVYGARSAYPAATISFSLDEAPQGGAVLSIDGLDDESGAEIPISVAVNGVTIYSGSSPFQTWNAIGQGENANWTTATFDVPAGVLVAGQNSIRVANLAPAANFGGAPYVLLSGGQLSTRR